MDILASAFLSCECFRCGWQEGALRWAPCPGLCGCVRVHPTPRRFGRLDARGRLLRQRRFSRCKQLLRACCAQLCTSLPRVITSRSCPMPAWTPWRHYPSKSRKSGSPTAALSNRRRPSQANCRTFLVAVSKLLSQAGRALGNSNRRTG